ncbi:MAG: hypothetical protein K9K88_08625 [Desulfobacterales bacterium]|nr:hypothetical protein [Desulfobacterales bacterium]
MLLIFAGVWILLVSPAEAHRVNVFAWVEGDTVYTESSFPGGREVKEGQVAVYDDQTGEKLLEGRTDEAGKFSFKVPRQSALRIEMLAGMGHKNEWIVRAQEIAAAGKVGKELPDTDKPSGPAAPENERAAAPSGSTAPADAVEIEKTVEKVLDRKLSPVVKMIAESRRDRTTVQDVVGGIGYILGLAGLGAYIHYRRKIKELEKN